MGKLNASRHLGAMAPPTRNISVHVYHYKTFTIMVWNHSLLGNLDSTPSVQPGEIPCTQDCI